MIITEGLYKSFGEQQVLSGIDLRIDTGERLILIGQNGAGKTTLIRSILGEYHPDKGRVSIFGIDPSLDRVGSLKNVSFVPQLPPPLKLTITEVIDYSSGVSGFDKNLVKDYCQQLDLDIKPHMNKQFLKLSGGMKQKLMISIAFARDTQIMIFDEPTANLDPAGRKMFSRLLADIDTKKTFIFISHRRQEVANLVNRLVELDLGRVVRDEKI